MIDFPQIITTLERHLSDMNNATKTGTLLNYKISEDWKCRKLSNTNCEVIQT